MLSINLLKYAAPAFIVAALALWLYNMRVDALEAKWQAQERDAVATAQNTEIANCQAGQKQAEEISDGFEKQLPVISASGSAAFSGLQQLPSAGNAKPAAPATGRPHATAGANGLYCANAGDIKALYQRQVTATKQAAQLAALQKYVSDLCH